MGAGCSAVQDTGGAARPLSQASSGAPRSTVPSAGQLLGKKISVAAQSLISDPSKKYQAALQVAHGSNFMPTTLKVDPRHKKRESIAQERVSMTVLNPMWTASDLENAEMARATMDLQDVPRGQGLLLSAAVAARGDGSFDLTWEPQRPGRYLVRAWLAGEEVEGSGFAWTVVPDVLDIARCFVDAPEDQTLHTTAGEPVSVIASLFDTRGNPRAFPDGRDGPRFSVDVAPSSSALTPAERAAAAAAAACRLEHIGGHQYRLSFTGARAGQYAVFVRLSHENGGEPRGLRGSPFSVTVNAGVPSHAHSATVVPPSDLRINAGDICRVTVALKDKYSNPCAKPVPCSSLRLLGVGVNVWPTAFTRSVLATAGSASDPAAKQSLATTRVESKEGEAASAAPAAGGADPPKPANHEELFDSWVEGAAEDGTVKPGRGGEVVLGCKFEKAQHIRVHVTYNGGYIPNSVPLTVLAGVPVSELTTVEGEPAGQSAAGEPCSIRIGLRDRFGNRVTAEGVPPGLVRAVIVPVSGAARIADLPAITLGSDPAGGGGFVAHFRPTAAGIYRVRLALDAEAMGPAPEPVKVDAPPATAGSRPATVASKDGPPATAGPASTKEGPPATAGSRPASKEGPPATAGSKRAAPSRQRLRTSAARRVEELPDIKGSPVSWTVAAGPYERLVLNAKAAGGEALRGCAKGRRGVAARVVAADAHGNPCASAVQLRELEILIRPAAEGWEDGGEGAAGPARFRPDVGPIELVELAADGGAKVAGTGGLFEAHITPAELGELSVMARYKGEPLAGSPCPFRVVRGDVCERLCALEAEREAPAGAMHPVRVLLRDELGAPPARFDPPPKVEVRVDGPSEYPVHVEGPAPRPRDRATLEAAFEARRVGAYVVRAFVNDVEVSGSPVEVAADIGPLHPPACLFPSRPKDGRPVVATAGRGDDATTFTVLGCDAAGNVRAGFGDELEARVEGPGPVATFAAEETEGVHLIRLGVPVAGTYTVDLAFRGVPGTVPGCPFQMVVAPGAMDGRASTLEVRLPVHAAGAHAVVAGNGFEAAVASRDAWGNLRADQDDSGTLTLSMRPAGRPVGASDEVRVPFAREAAGLYRAIVPSTAQAGTYDVTAETLLEGLGERPTQVQVLPAQIDVSRCAVEQWRPAGEAEGAAEVVPGEAFAAVVALRDVYGNFRSAGGDEPRVWLQIRGPDVGCVWPTAVHQGSGRYYIEARPALPGSYTALVSVDGVPLGAPRRFRCVERDRTAFETPLEVTISLPEAPEGDALVAARWLRRPPAAAPRRLALLVLECSRSVPGAWAGLRDALGPCIRRLYDSENVRTRVVCFGAPAGPAPFNMGRYERAEDLLGELGRMEADEPAAGAAGAAAGGEGPCFFELLMHLQNAMRLAVEEERAALGERWELSYLVAFYGEHTCKKLRHSRNAVADLVRSLGLAEAACGAARTAAHIVGVGPRFDSELAQILYESLADEPGGSVACNPADVEGTSAALETLARAIASGTSEYIAQVHLKSEGQETLLCGVPLCGGGVLSGLCAVQRGVIDRAVELPNSSFTVAVTTKMGRVLLPSKATRPRLLRLGPSAGEEARLYAALRAVGDEMGRAGVANSAGRLDRERWMELLGQAAATARIIAYGALLGVGPLEEWLEARAGLLRALLASWAPSGDAFRAACFNLTVGADLDAFALHARLSEASELPPVTRPERRPGAKSPPAARK